MLYSELRTAGKPADSKVYKEAQMNYKIYNNILFRKDGLLLFNLAESKLPRLLDGLYTCK
jgi:hypothetical protein